MGKQQQCSKREELHSKQPLTFLQGRYLEETLGTRRDLYDRLPEFFRSWADGNVVLMGDAVHPMMPNLGQGGCQAIEDRPESARCCDVWTQKVALFAYFYWMDTRHARQSFDKS